MIFWVRLHLQILRVTAAQRKCAGHDGRYPRVHLGCPGLLRQDRTMRSRYPAPAGNPCCLASAKRSNDQNRIKRSDGGDCRQQVDRVSALTTPIRGRLRAPSFLCLMLGPMAVRVQPHDRHSFPIQSPAKAQASFCAPKPRLARGTAQVHIRRRDHPSPNEPPAPQSSPSANSCSPR